MSSITLGRLCRVSFIATSMALWLAHAPTLASDTLGQPAAVDAVPAAPPPQVLVMLRSPPAHARVDGGYGGNGYGDASRQQSQRRIGERIALSHGFAVVTLWPMPSLGMDCMVIRLPPGVSLETSIATLQTHREVAWAQAMNEFEAMGHVDPLYSLQPSASQWRLDDLHAIATGRGIRIALLDSGVDESHPDLENAIELTRNFVDGQRFSTELHGTAVAGLISARADNGIGMVGVAPGARLLALRACREVSAQKTSCDTLSLAKALEFAIERRAEIINMSLSGPFDLLLARLIDVALQHREQVVAAVDGRVAGGGFPAGYPGVIAVADTIDTPAGAGRSGAWMAPARDLPTTVPGGGWRLVSGTSFAAGQVSGLLALLAQARVGGDGSRPGIGSQSALVRRPDGGIDACASLMRAVTNNRASGPASTGCKVMSSKYDGIAER